LKCEDELEIM